MTEGFAPAGDSCVGVDAQQEHFEICDRLAADHPRGAPGLVGNAEMDRFDRRDFHLTLIPLARREARAAFNKGTNERRGVLSVLRDRRAAKPRRALPGPTGL